MKAVGMPIRTYIYLSTYLLQSSGFIYDLCIYKLRAVRWKKLEVDA